MCAASVRYAFSEAIWVLTPCHLTQDPTQHVEHQPHVMVVGEAIEGARVIAADAKPRVADRRHARRWGSGRHRLPAHAEDRHKAAVTDQTTRKEPRAEAPIGGEGGLGITDSDHPRVIEMKVERRRGVGVVTMGRMPARGW